MERKSKAPLIFGIFVVAFIGLILVLFALSQGKAAITNEYDALTTTDHVFVQINFKELEKMIEEQETFFLYMGSPLCSHCQSQIGYMDLEAKANGVTTVYYLRTEYGILSEDSLIYLEDYMGLDGTPTVSYIVNGIMYYTIADHRSEFDTYEEMYDTLFSLGSE